MFFFICIHFFSKNVADQELMFDIKGVLHPYPGVAETLVTNVLHWRNIPITGDQIAIYYI